MKLKVAKKVNMISLFIPDFLADYLVTNDGCNVGIPHQVCTVHERMTLIECHADNPFPALIRQLVNCEIPFLAVFKYDKNYKTTFWNLLEDGQTYLEGSSTTDKARKNLKIHEVQFNQRIDLLEAQCKMLGNNVEHFLEAREIHDHDFSTYVTD